MTCFFKNYVLIFMPATTTTFLTSQNDETDWGYIFDDLDQDNWEDYMGESRGVFSLLKTNS